MKYLPLPLLLLFAFVGVSTNALAQAAQWHKISPLPEGGNIIDMASDNSGRIYALAGFYSGIYYTTNNGQSWSQVQGTEAFWNVLDIEVDKKNGILYVGTTHEGIYWTSDFGATWHNEYISTNPVSGMHATFISVGVKQGTSTVVGSDVGFTTALIYTTTNGGNSWTVQSPAPFTGALDLEFLPNGDLLAATSNGVYKSVNNGASWTALNNGISAMQTRALAYKQSNGYMFAATDLNAATLDTTAIGVYVSTNNGASWTLASNGITNRKVRTLLVDSTSGNIYAGTQGGGIFVSTNNGSSWAPVNQNLQSLVMTSIVRNNSGVFAGSERSGVAFSANSATGWTYRNSGIMINSIKGMVMDNAGTFYMLDEDVTGVHKKTAGSPAWQQMGANQLPSFPGTKIMRDNSGTLYACFSTINGYGKTGVFKSTDGGVSWTDISGGIPIPSSVAWVIFGDLEIGPGGVLYVYVNNEIFRSTNGGASWTSIMQFINSSFIDMDITSAGHLYVYSLPMTITPVLEVTTDQGATFSTVNTGSLWLTQYADLIIDKQDSLYIKDNNIIHKRNGIGNWTALPAGGWDVNNPYSSYTKVYFDNTNGIYVSTNGEGMYYSPNGTTWTNISAGIPTYNSTAFGTVMLTLVDLCFDSNNTPYARSFDEEGGNILGVYKFSVPNAIDELVKDKSGLTFYPNPSNGTVNLSFYADMAGDASLTVYNFLGQELLRTSTNIHQGMNSLTFDVASFPVGLYTCRLICGEKTYSAIGLKK
jgi:hypothetical protein